ncbi:MAG: FAD binding domain-containing protein [SAR324 cluster bacterium]|nr:FAD binding domain-containing protein [SAR324 cluster bacterium]
MKPFAYHQPGEAAEAGRLLETHGGQARLIAGGSDLLGELKDGIVHYGQLISLSRVKGLDQIHQGASGLRLGAMVILARMEGDPLLSGPYRMLAEAARGVATPEIRNQGTLGGNLCQRPRCLHYRSPWVSCLKKGGSGCPAMESGHQHYLSVMGAGDCRAVNPSDLAPPLVALAGVAIIDGASGSRSLPLTDFFAGPDQIAGRDNALRPGELLVAVELPPMPENWRGTYLKARERTAGDFALISAAFGCRIEEGRIEQARLVLGGASAGPMRCPEAEALLEGQAPSAETAARAAEAAFADASPLPHNGFKLDLGRALVSRAISQITSSTG